MRRTCKLECLIGKKFGVLNVSKLLCVCSCFSYNPRERREVCKGGKEATRKSAHSQSSNKGSTAQRPPSSHNSRRNEASAAANHATQAAKVAKPSSAAAPAYDEQVFCFQFTYK